MTWDIRYHDDKLLRAGAQRSGKVLTHKQLRAKALARPEVAAAFEQVADEYLLLDEFLKARVAQGLTQTQVAQKIGTTQSAVARMESGSGKHSPSFATLTKYAEALGCKLEVRLVRKSGDAPLASRRPHSTTRSRTAA